MRAVYRILNRLNDRAYVGSSVDVASRLADHIRSLRRGKHPSVPLSRAWAKYGESAFSLEVLEIVADDQDLRAREQHWIDSLAAYGAGYNGRPMAADNSGHRPTDETRRKMSEAKRGKPSPKKGVPLSDATRAKLSARKRGIQQSPEWVAKASIGRRGQKRSAETRLKMSEAAKLFGARPDIKQLRRESAIRRNAAGTFGNKTASP